MKVETRANIQITSSDGECTNLPTLWLRDVCPCQACRIAQTQEKRFHLASLDSVSVENLTFTDDQLFVTRAGGYTSQYPRAFLSGDHASATPPWQPWTDDYSSSYVDFASFQMHDTSTETAIEKFLRSGIFILENAPTEEEKLELLAKCLGPIREVLLERIHNSKVDPSGYNVTHISFGLPPRNDFASYSGPPSVQVLHVQANKATRGRSTIFDGWGRLEEFRSDEPEAFEVLCRVEVPFREFDKSNETWACELII